MRVKFFPKEMEVYPARLVTSLRTSDSLTDNESYFFAELKRLKLIIDKQMCIRDSHYVAAVLDVGCLAERRVRTADIVMVASQHNGPYFAAAHHPERSKSSEFIIST